MSIGQAGAVKVEIKVGSRDIPAEHHLSVVVDRDIGQPDMAAIVVSNQDHKYSDIAVAETVEIKIGDDGVSIYKGEVVGLEPVYKGGEKSRILIRCMNKLHRLLRIRKSITFTDKSDQQILSQVVGDAGLTLDWKHDKAITYKHVYQHNQTDLEFLRTRAGRMGCHVWCVDTKVFCKQVAWEETKGVELSIQQETGSGSKSGQQLKAFSPRLSSAPTVKKVTVKGWNPETKELITGMFSALDSKLGAENAVTGSKAHGSEETFTVDHPIWSKEEADALAKARLVDCSLMYMTGEAEAVGDPKFELGKTVKITVNPEKPDDVFNGLYYVMGLTHRQTAGGKDKGGGYTTILRVARDGQKGK